MQYLVTEQNTFFKFYQFFVSRNPVKFSKPRLEPGFGIRIHGFYSSESRKINRIRSPVLVSKKNVEKRQAWRAGQTGDCLFERLFRGKKRGDARAL